MISESWACDKANMPHPTGIRFLARSATAFEWRQGSPWRDGYADFAFTERNTKPKWFLLRRAQRSFRSASWSLARTTGPLVGRTLSSNRERSSGKWWLGFGGDRRWTKVNHAACVGIGLQSGRSNWKSRISARSEAGATDMPHAVVL